MLDSKRKATKNSNRHQIHWPSTVISILTCFAGGVFLIYKTIKEILHKLKGVEEGQKIKSTTLTVTQAIVQIAIIDIVFSFDSILTAIGLVDNVLIMILAVVISMLIMIFFSGAISNFINKHPTLQILALAFLIMIGMMLVAEGFHQHINKSYIYSAIAFSLVVELINMRLRKNRQQMNLNNEYL